MQHNFMPGNTVNYKGKKAIVKSRGATRNKYYVEIVLSNGRNVTLVNEDIVKLLTHV